MVERCRHCGHTDLQHLRMNRDVSYWASTEGNEVLEGCEYSLSGCPGFSNPDLARMRDLRAIDDSIDARKRNLGIPIKNYYE